MEKKIGQRVFLMGVFSLLLTTALLVGLFHSSLEERGKREVQQLTRVLAEVYPWLNEPSDLQPFADNTKRITLIDENGKVLYDSKSPSSRLENHAEREEVVEAMETGRGDSARTSSTLHTYSYYYALRLSDGCVLRVGAEIESFLADFQNSLPAMVVVLVLILVISALVSRFLTKSVVSQMEKMIWHMDEVNDRLPKEMLPLAQAIRSYQEKKEEGEKWRQQFTANVTHELKTPLTSISGYAEMLKSGMVQPEDIKTFAGKIHKETGRLITLINDILELSRLDEPGNIGPMEPVDLTRLARDTAEMLSMKAEQFQVQIHLTGGTESVYVLGNKTMLEEVVYNLCDNAIRYNLPGGYVQIETFLTGNRPTLVVKDNGIGISLEDQERIFERFYRVDKSRSKDTGGTGLGLAIVKHVVMRHNGRISVESKIGGPTRIQVIFPSVEEQRKTQQAAQQKEGSAE